MQQKGKSQKKRHTGKIILIVVLILLAVVLAAVFILQRQWLKEQQNGTFMSGTTVNGIDVSGKTPEEVADMIAADVTDFTVEIDEDGTAVLSGTAADFGYTPDKDALIEKLEEDMTAQTSTFARMMHIRKSGDALQENMTWAVDESVFDNFVQSANFSVARTATTDPEIVQNEDGQYTVSEGVKGNEIDDAALQSYVKSSIDQAIDDGSSTEGVKIEVPDDVYTSAEPDESQIEALEEQAEQLNSQALIEKYQNMTVTYQFGSETEVLDADTIMSWLSIGDDGTISIDEEQEAAWVSDLASKYNTRYIARTFQATDGETISFSAGSVEYGYTIDEEAECEQLTSDIEAGEPVTREPVYIETNSYGNPLYYSREGTDDLNGTYVEVDISEQHVWFYKNGTLIVEGDCVTGDVSEGYDTEIGIFPLAYKESPSILTGQNANGGYETEVSFWMPFFEGEGLHDATWRSSFGGDIYKTNGSHGCVNLPYDVAEQIYNNIEAGMAIVIHE